MYNNKFAAKSFEQQHLQRVRKSAHAIIDINIAIGDIHRMFANTIDVTPFEKATAYVNKYVSYTNIWNMKFVYNLESPEIAMLQLFHVQYILDHFPETAFVKEREIVEENIMRFRNTKPFSDESVAERYDKFMAVVQSE